MKNKEAILGRLFKEVENGHSPFIFPQQISLRSLHSCKLHLSLADKGIEYSVALVVCGSKFIQGRAEPGGRAMNLCLAVGSCGGELSIHQNLLVPASSKPKTQSAWGWAQFKIKHFCFSKEPDVF